MEYRSASSAVPPMAWADTGLMYPSRPVVRPDSSSILLTSHAAKQISFLYRCFTIRWPSDKPATAAVIKMFCRYCIVNLFQYRPTSGAHPSVRIILR
jgi:hypothetical protein